MVAGPAFADLFNPLKTFATCAGRLSATMEYEWMFDGAASEDTRSARAAVLDLVSAVMTADQGRDVLQWRLEGKYAQSVLLTRATFNDDPHDAAWAHAQSTRYRQSCTGLLLG